MFQRLLLLSALFGTLCLLADTVAVDRTRNGYPLIVPQVQKLEAAAGSFTLPARLTVAAPPALDLAPLARLYAETVKGGSVRPAAEGALCRFELATEGVPESVEGYTLAVTPGGIVVRARDVRGLFYGMQTLKMMLRHRTGANSLRCCAITDRPDLEVRGLLYHLRRTTPAEVDRICHVIDVLGELKYNTLTIYFEDNFPYTDSPFTKRKTTFSRADVEKILAAAKRNHMEVIPILQLVSHAKWMDTHKDWAKLREGKTNSFCLSNPELQPLVEKCVRETADLIKPRYFHLCLDEIEQCGFPQCPKCKAVPVMELMLRHLLPVKKILAERGITPIIWNSSFFGYAEPVIVKGLDITDFPERFGMDTVIEAGDYGVNPSAMIGKAVRRRGFKKLRYLSFGVKVDNVRNLPKIAREVGAEGVTLSYWSMMPATFDKPGYPYRRSLYPSVIAHANYTWKIDDEEFARLPFDSSLLLQELLDGQPERTFRGKAAPVALGGAFNRAIADDPVFPAFDAATAAEMRRIAAADPAGFDLAIRNGAPLAVVLSGGDEDGFARGPVTIPIGTTATGASFLVTAALFNNFGLFRWNQYADGKNAFKVGKFEIVYADGSTEHIPLTMNVSINDWNTAFGGTFCRAVVRAGDRNGALASLYAVDWRNPHPEKEIRKIVFASKGDSGVAPALFALSLSDAAKTPAGAAGEPPARFAPARRDPAKRIAAVDFDAAVPPKMSVGAKWVKDYSCRIVADPERGKVLEMRIPVSEKVLARPWADFPVSPPPESFASVVFDIRVSGWNAIYRPDFYMSRGKDDVGTLTFADELGDRWCTVCIPKERLFNGKKLIPNRISIRFFMCDNGTPCTVRIGSIYYCDRVLPCRANVTMPVK